MFCDGVRESLRRKKAATYLLCQNISNDMERKAKSIAPWQDRTAHARQSINHNTQLLGDDIEMTISHGVRYGRYLEKGTPPHDIHLKHKKAFMWNGLSHPIKKNPIHHPGTKSYPAIIPAAEYGKKQLDMAIKKLWEE